MTRNDQENSDRGESINEGANAQRSWRRESNTKLAICRQSFNSLTVRELWSQRIDVLPLESTSRICSRLLFALESTPVVETCWRRRERRAAGAELSPTGGASFRSKRTRFNSRRGGGRGFRRSRRDIEEFFGPQTPLRYNLVKVTSW